MLPGWRWLFTLVRVWAVCFREMADQNPVRGESSTATHAVGESISSTEDHARRGGGQKDPHSRRSQQEATERQLLRELLRLG